MEYCIKKAYEPFLHSYDEILETYDYDMLPCLSDLFSILLSQRSSQIKELAERLIVRKNEIFRVLTAKKSEYGMNRLKVYNLQAVPDTLKASATLAILDRCRQEAENKLCCTQYTWLYIEGIHRMFYKPFAAEYLRQHYMETAQNKWITTGITNHTAVFFENSIANHLIAASHYVILLIPSIGLRSKFMKLISVSPSEYQCFKSNEPNFGLLYNKVNLLSFHV